MKRQGLFAFAAAGVIIGGAWLITASAIRAQQPPAAPAAPAAPPAQAVPPIGPADPNLQIVPVPDGKKVHLLPATLETTQWGWFNNAQPPVLRINSGDTVVMETMMHSHNQVIPGTTIEQIKKLRTDFPGRGPHTLTGPIYISKAPSPATFSRSQSTRLSRVLTRQTSTCRACSASFLSSSRTARSATCISISIKCRPSSSRA